MLLLTKANQSIR